MQEEKSIGNEQKCQRPKCLPNKSWSYQVDVEIPKCQPKMGFLGAKPGVHSVDVKSRIFAKLYKNEKWIERENWHTLAQEDYKDMSMKLQITIEHNVLTWSSDDLLNWPR